MVLAGVQNKFIFAEQRAQGLQMQPKFSAIAVAKNNTKEGYFQKTPFETSLLLLSMP